MRVLLILALAGTLLPFGCDDDDETLDPNAVPEWVDELIDELESEPVRNPPALIARYTYKGETVYFVPQYCCDFFSTLYDSDGNVTCHPDGGIAGQGDMRCPDFFEERRNEKIIWRDPRGIAIE